MKSSSCLRAWACTLVWSALVLHPLVRTILATADDEQVLLELADIRSLLDDDSFQDDVVEAEESVSTSPFMIVIDGGSTGSRLHVFEFVETTTNQEGGDDDDEPPRLDCVRRGSARANYPLSAFGRTGEEQLRVPLNATAVAQHMIPAFIYAAEQVPGKYHASTAVYYQATAGMRLLEETEQDAVYDALYQGLMESSAFKFTSLERSQIATLSGEAEGFYGAVAANFLKGTIDVHLQMIPTTTTTTNPLQGKSHHDENNDSHDFLEASVAAAHAADHHHHHHGPIGALDMGGSSTQIVFLPGQQQQQQSHRAQSRSDARSCRNMAATAVSAVDDDNLETDVMTTTCHVAAPEEMPSRLNGQDFFATSYLSYGVDQFRERLWTTWVNEHKARVAADGQSCDAKVLENPCTFVGYELEWEGYTLIGTGDAHLCVQEVQRLIPHPVEPDHEDLKNLGSHVGGVEHPPVRGKFFAMSLYFFTLDSLRELSHPDKEAYEALNLSWPTPSIAELYNALDGLCSRSWEGDLQEIQHDAHAFTRAEVLPHRCLESVYMVTLLRDGYGFAPESRDITFTFLVDGSEVEWSLGMALAYHAQQQQEEDEQQRQQQEEQEREQCLQHPVAAAAPNSENHHHHHHQRRHDRANATREQGRHGHAAAVGAGGDDDDEATTPTSSNRLIHALSQQLWSYVA